MTDADLLKKIVRFLCLSEQDSGSNEVEYDKVYRYRDGNGGRFQWTLSLGFTEDGGNLRKVVDAYLANGGTNEVLKANVGKIGKGLLAENREFGKALVAAGKEKPMRDAQDAVFLSAYLGPSIRWTERNGFRLPLSFAVAADSFLHSGQMSPKLVNSFAERTPLNGGDEKRWMLAYLNARLAWFKRVTGPLRTCQFRPQFFLGEIKKSNWALQCPLKVAGKGSIC